MNLNEYNQCVKSYSDGIFRFILKNLRDSFEAENIVQNTFEKLWLRREQVEIATAKAYLFKVAYNNMIDVIRKRNRYTDINEARDMSVEHNEYSNLTEWVNRAVELLPEKQRIAITLRDFEGYDYKGIGELTGMNESQVKVNIFRARQFIKAYISKLEPSLQ